ncbi:hypothetical protein Poli38472_007608 [Pythium oligandrum]|uniref:FYVE-type domain-containing protein n=1 Tax=Pythium oligandrum TaxID=41045 RepID=A0A8K1FM76_PYTOL|nr:hypothetical protein Poli38472_007608 [Pythium oligandrum]|eukprot:TMW67936.1 hypothetical protein Poli38472_007608 [Pythium oligandrum]
MAKKQQTKLKKFRCPPLSSSRKDQIKQEANVACDELLKFSAAEIFNDSPDMDTMTGVEGLKWEYEEQLDSVRIEKVKVKSENKKSIHYFRGVTQIEATLDEIMELYEVDMEHPNVMLENKLTPDLLHSVILYEIKPYNFHENTMFIGIRWSALRSPYVLVRNRDYCYLEIQRRFTLPDGRQGFTRCHHSVKIKSCPDMEKSHGFVRASMYRSGLVFVESRRDRRMLDCVQAVYTDLKGNVPQWVASLGIRARMMNLEHLKKHISMKRVANQTFARRSQMMAPSKVKTCFVCVDDIGAFKRKYNCHKCGEVICGRCKVVMNADIPVVGKMKLTICSLCSLAINRNLMPDSSGSNDLRSLGDRPFSVTPGQAFDALLQDQPPLGRRRAQSLNSFHTANFDETSTVHGSLLSAEV